MSLILFDGRYLVADRQITIGYLTQKTTKIEELSPGVFAAGVGTSSEVAKAMAWVKSDEPKPTCPSFEGAQVVVFAKCSPVKVYIGAEPFVVDGCPYANGEDAAQGAGLALMLAGFSAKEAVVRLLKSHRIVSIGLGMSVVNFDHKNPKVVNYELDELA